MYQPRIPIKFSNIAGSAEFVFPLAEYSYEFDQPLYVPSEPQVGAHGEFDMLRDGSAAKGAMLVRLGFTVFEEHPKDVETTIDEMQAKLWSYGRGKLWTSGLDSAGAVELRWARGRVMQMPSLRWSGGQVLSKAATLGFRCDPFWYSEDPLLESALTVESDPDVFEVTNPGNAPVYNAILTLSGTYTNPVIRNNTNGYQVASTTDGSSADHLLRFDAGRPAIEKSTNNGSTWANDYANYVRQSGQVHLMVLDPGVNEIEVTGCSSGSLTIAGNGAFH